MTARPALPFLGLYLLLALGAFVLMRDHAFHPTDDGFILAYSWRIAQGEVPYRDFIYVRPPLTPYLHAAWIALPDGWQIQAGRLAFYLELAAAAFLTTWWAVGRGLRATLPVLALAGGSFLLALHNFPPMPWPTVDGIFFASAGATALLLWNDGRRLRWLVASTALFTLAGLAKQSFVPLVPLAAGYALAVAFRRRDGRAAIAAVAPPVAIGAVVVGLALASGTFGALLQQLVAPTQLRPTAEHPWTGDFVTVGILPYLSLPLAVFALLPPLGFVFAVRDRSRLAGVVTTPAVLAVLLVAAIALPTEPYRGGIVLFLATAAVAVAEAFRAATGRPPAVPLIAYVLVLATGWAASLSFAYQTPLLAMGMMTAVVGPALPRSTTPPERVLAATTLALVLTVVVTINVALPYRDLPRPELTADLGGIYARFGVLYTNETNAARHRELRDLSRRYALERGRPFVVLSAFPLAHFLSGTRNPLSLDWLEPQEYAGNEERLRRELETSRPVLIVQRQRGIDVGEGRPPYSCAAAAARAPVFAADLLAHASLAAEATYFCVYLPE